MSHYFNFTYCATKIVVLTERLNFNMFISLFVFIPYVNHSRNRRRMFNCNIRISLFCFQSKLYCTVLNSTIDTKKTALINNIKFCAPSYFCDAKYVFIWSTYFLLLSILLYQCRFCFINVGLFLWMNLFFVSIICIYCWEPASQCGVQI